MYKIGERVICIDASTGGLSAIPLKLHKEYVILDVRYCVKCGQQLVDIGAGAVRNLTRGHCRCGHIDVMKMGDTLFFGHRRFVPLQELDAVMSEVNEILKVEEEVC